MKRRLPNAIQGRQALRLFGERPALDLLTELAELLLGHGITPTRLRGFMERAFAQAAARSSRLKNGKISYSRVAARTGLRRSVVRELLRDEGPNWHPSNALEKAVLGWRTDKEFLDNSGRPKLLSMAGKRASFGRLAEKYGCDIPPRALLEELIGARLVVPHGSVLRLTAPKRRAKPENSGVVRSLVSSLANCIAPSSRAARRHNMIRRRTAAKVSTLRGA